MPFFTTNDKGDQNEVIQKGLAGDSSWYMKTPKGLVPVPSGQPVVQRVIESNRTYNDIPVSSGSPPAATPTGPAPGSPQDIIANWQYPSFTPMQPTPTSNTYGRNPLAPFVPQGQSSARPSVASLLANLPQRAPISNLWRNQQPNSPTTALSPVAQMAGGGAVQGVGGGQADNVMTTARPKSFIIPADVVAHLGDGSSAEGHRRLSQTWARMGYACGGRVGYASGGPVAPVPVALSPDEHEVPPEVVSALGGGSNAAGTAKLHQMMNHVRAHKARKGHPPLAKSPLAYMGAKNTPKPVSPPVQVQQSPLMA